MRPAPGNPDKRSKVPPPDVNRRYLAGSAAVVFQPLATVQT
jgi:hypothetical protein